MVVGTQGPLLQAFISAGFSPTHSPPPLPSLTPPRVRHSTSLFCTPGPHCVEHWGAQSVNPFISFNTQATRCYMISFCCTHSVGPVSEVPIGYTRPHVALLTALWSEPVMAYLIAHHAAIIADAVHTPWPPPHPTVNWALWWTDESTICGRKNKNLRDLIH